jgi:hypothetical protein
VRVFSIDVADTPGVDIQNLDICGAVGPNTALVQVVRGVSVTDGALDVGSIYGPADDPELAAIEALPAS